MILSECYEVAPLLAYPSRFHDDEAKCLPFFPCWTLLCLLFCNELEVPKKKTVVISFELVFFFFLFLLLDHGDMFC